MNDRPPGDWRVDTPPAVIEHLNKTARAIKADMPSGWGFALLMFTYGEGGQMVWLSSADRQDMLKALQEFLRAQGD